MKSTLSAAKFIQICLTCNSSKCILIDTDPYYANNHVENNIKTIISLCTNIIMAINEFIALKQRCVAIAYCYNK